MVFLFNHLTSRFDVLACGRCKENESFISEAVIIRNKLESEVEQDNTIKIFWRKLDGILMVMTRFRVISDSEIRNDLVLGGDALETDTDYQCSS